MIPRLIAFYLPQFHSIPENDIWWGPGFTEWRTTAVGRPLFRGHYQPHLPAELGCYDLRQSDTRIAQAALAASHGIDGFCYYHYWFHGKRLLETPFQEVLDSGTPAFPFCLCWANEPWTRRYDGRSRRQVLMPQTYSETDDLNHIRWLSRAFLDRRYLRVDGKALFLVYRGGACRRHPVRSGYGERKPGSSESVNCSSAPLKATFPASGREILAVGGLMRMLNFSLTSTRAASYRPCERPSRSSERSMLADACFTVLNSALILSWRRRRWQEE